MVVSDITTTAVTWVRPAADFGRTFFPGIQADKD